MPKSKRNKVVSLTKVKKKDRAWKEGLLEKIRQCLDTYPTVYLFKHYNMRTERFKQLREELQDSSRFILGSTSLMQVALGRTAADEYKTGLSRLSELIKGTVGLLFTKLSHEEVQGAIESYVYEDYARVGARAAHDFALTAGPLGGPMGPLPHTLEPQLRKFGLPTKLNKGVVELLADHTVCRTGQKLDANQAGILRVFDIKMAECKLKLLAVWRSGEGEGGSGGGVVEELSEDEEEYGGASGGEFDAIGDDLAMGSGGFSDEPEGRDGEDDA
ncbi:hypothetical protein VOLCADRAFT_72439 [Volvox carteri f. nagariensis]|uniref:Ribosome assembly factor mrt4 n=1 Tax=Volvox carteri f. nagariensis TaxID=3068 RepID=D8TI00_VOLCA|nr:uncharacterized protein VOLCADRAFT_72439 [Volvox carteri f. nagariensis]EFJ52804.1 hypothetical protein VOLCADRAFT_72439 [Volvox carteri f. nagariensis]|eukprot:XP_002945809.1 hypothetical protein VOLCADRAFT_72439 [Volvox carteri f. nagariensis]